MDRFFIPPANWDPSGKGLVLLDEEAHHCQRVMRKQVGDEIGVFDGAGTWARGKITSLGAEIPLEIIELGTTPRPSLEVELAVGIPKGKTFDLIIQKSVELGISRIQPLMTEQGVVRIEKKEAAKKVEKWNRVALEACKQCGQNWLPEVKRAEDFQSWLPNREGVDRELIAALTRESVPLRETLKELKETENLRILVGPEGDFSKREYEATRQAKMSAIQLGQLVLRVETAVIYVLSNLFCHAEGMAMTEEDGAR
ncbi:MAG: RsmE family RNA methyltransferase [Akkermansiaceae bacterium]